MELTSDQILTQAVSNSWAFLETWLDDLGGVHGYVVHHHHDNMRILSPDTWTQAPCILGAIEIYKKSGDKRWLERASFLGNFLVDTYIREMHVYRNSNHEHKPLGKPGLIHNALPSYSLLVLAEERRLNGLSWQRYYEVAKDNVEHFILRDWDDSIGAISSEYHGLPARIHNMNSAAIMTLVALAKLEGNLEYIQHYASRIAESILRCQVQEGNFSGAYPYANNDENYRTLYSLITALGLLALYEASKEERFLISVRKLAKHISEFVDPETGLICHFHKKGYPQWVPDTLLFLVLCKEIGLTDVKEKLPTQEIRDRILRRQYCTGGFPLSIGFEDLWYKKEIPSKPSIKRWRDLLVTPNWNAWNFWSLSRLLPFDTQVPSPDTSFPLETCTDREEKEGPYRIVEKNDTVMFRRLDDGSVVGLFSKKKDIADYCVLEERGRYWGSLKRLLRYPELARRLILALPDLIPNSI